MTNYLKAFRPDLIIKIAMAFGMHWGPATPSSNHQTMNNPDFVENQRFNHFIYNGEKMYDKIIKHIRKKLEQKGEIQDAFDILTDKQIKYILFATIEIVNEN